MTRDLLDTAIAFLAVAAAGGIACAALCLLAKGRTASETPVEPARWSAGDVILGFFLFFTCQSAVAETLLKEPGDVLLQQDDSLRKVRSLFWVAIISTPPAVAAILLVLYYFRGIRPAQVGFHLNRMTLSLLLAFVVWLVVTPLDYLMFDGISKLVPVRPHPFEALAKHGGEPLDWTLLVVSAVVMAPLAEELLFRGVLFQWLKRTDLDGQKLVFGITLILVMPWAMILDTITRPNRPTDFGHWGYKDVPIWAGAAFVLALLPGYAWLLFKARSAKADPQLAQELDGLVGIYGSAMVFAIFHVSVWPSPIPLFFLGLALGWAAHRSGSLVAPITIHALFNAVACLQVMLSAMWTGLDR